MKRDTLILTIGLESGEFRSELRMPLPRTVDERNAAVERWLDLMLTGIRLSAERLDASFPVLGDRP